MRGKRYLPSLGLELFWGGRGSRILEYSVSNLIPPCPIGKPEQDPNCPQELFADSASSDWVSQRSLRQEFSYKALMEDALQRQGGGRQGRAERAAEQKPGLLWSLVLVPSRGNSATKTALLTSASRVNPSLAAGCGVCVGRGVSLEGQ